MFSSRSLLHLFFLGTLMLNTSCFRDAMKKQETAQFKSNDFKVTTLSGTSKTIMGSEKWSLPTNKVYDFRACIRNKVTNADLGPGHKFVIHLPDKSVFYATTDRLGCLNWVENIAFNFTSDSKFIELKRTLKGTDIYDGSVAVRIGINPWAEFRGESGAEVVNLDEQNLPKSKLVQGPESMLALTGLYEKASGQDILIDDEPMTEVTLLHNTDKGKMVRITIKARPFLEPNDINGEYKPYYFRKGEFRVYPQLVADYLGKGGKDRMILMPLMPENIKISRNGFLIYQKEVLLNREVTMGQIHLALKIEANDSPVALHDYQGLHGVAPFENIFSKHSPTQIQGVYSSKLFNYADYIQGAQNFDKLKEQGLAFDLQPIRFKTMGIRFVRVAPGETATRRTIIYRVETEVVDTITGSPVRKQSFKIKKLLTHKMQTRTDQRGETTDLIFTDDDGVLKWTDEISHLFYVAEQFYYPEVELTHVNSNYKKSLKMAINPWNSGWTFGTDFRGREEFYQNMNKQEKRDSLFMVDAFRYQTIRFRYEIDEYMTLNVKKAVVMALDPLTQRYTIEEGRKGGEELRDGIYLMKIALVKYYLDPFNNGTKLIRDEDDVHRIASVSDDYEAKKGEYITVVKKLLRVQGGRITTPIEFSMRDLRMMSIRSNIMVQIETVDEQRLLRDNIMDRKLRQLVDDYNEYNSTGMTDEEKDEFMRRNEELFIAERAKLADVMETELADLQAHRLKLADAEAARYQALQEFEARVKSQLSVHERMAKRRELLNASQEDFDNYVSSVRANLDQMEKKFSEHWRQWNADMGIPSNEIQDWEQYDAEIAGKGYYAQMMYQNADKERIGLGQNKNVYDYLASMQVFMMDHGLPEDISINDLRAMRLNNYTQNPAAPFVDLDLYRNNAGLKRRTFIGPCTLVANDNLSEMRPTDTIDEKYCDRIDCSENLIKFGFQVDNKVFEQSAYHGAIKPFAMLHVDNIIELYKKYEKNYYHGMKALSQLGKFLETYNLDYVSLNNNFTIPGPKRFKEGCVVKTSADDDFDPNAYDDCYEDARENVLSFRDFREREQYSDAESLLVEFFKYSYYDENVPEEPKTNNLPSLLDKTGDELVQMTTDVQEELFGGTIGEVVRDVFTDEQSRAKYLQEFEKGRLKNFDKVYLTELLYSNSEQLTLTQSVKFCGILSEGIAAELKKQKLLKLHTRKNSYLERKRGAGLVTIAYEDKLLEEKLREVCLKKIKFNTETGKVGSDHISFDRRLRVIETGTYQHIEGKNLNVNVGYDFAVSDGRVIQVASGLGISGSVNPLSKIPVVKDIASVNISASKDVASVKAIELGRSSSVSSAVFLVVQQATMEIELRKFERCFTASFMPTMFYDMKAEDLDLTDGKKVGDSDVARALTKGIMVCEGRYNKQPKKIIENYYYITQHFTAGDMLDEGNLLNHIWLLPLRGTADFHNFMRLVNAKPINKDGEVIEESDRYSYPMVRLKTNYNQVLPSFPGMYTVQGIK